jgi:hypothetical protein
MLPDKKRPRRACARATDKRVLSTTHLACSRAVRNSFLRGLALSIAIVMVGVLVVAAAAALAGLR